MTPEERRHLQALVQELWRREGPYVGTHVGDLAWGPTHRADEQPWRVRIWDEGAGAWMRRAHELEYELLPELRGGPFEHELLDWAESEAGGELTTYSLGTDGGRLAFLRGRGYEPKPDASPLDFHIRQVDDADEVEPPAGFRLRTAEPADLERRVAVHRAAWEPSRVTVESYREVIAAWPYRAELDCVVEAPNGELAASCLAWLDDENGVGELEPVGTAPAYRRRGLASAVCRFALRRLCEEGATDAVVYSNTPEAKALYLSIGFVEHTRSLPLAQTGS
jgi:ribosomal protein S18 acetylase RimI-like enzyme